MADPLAKLQAALADAYTIERELGAGGMATVYLAEDLKHHRKVALKVLRPDLAATMGPDRFVREVTIAANLQHPHVLPLYDSGAVEGFLYYVMPYVEGPSLRQKLLRQGELPVHDAIRVLRDVADAMAYAHAQGVVHRDIKPENVMLSGRHAMVTDFGVAKAVSEATGRQQLTTAGVALGTPAYMAPEQAAADPHMDHRADIYAFGALAYELLAGRPPFVGPTPQAVLAAHVTTAAQPVSEHRTSIPPALGTLVMKCLEKKPADRFQTAEELILQLEAVLTPSGGITPTETQPVLVQQRRGWWPAAVAGLAIIGAAAVLTWRVLSPGTPALSSDVVLVVPFENATGDAELDGFAQVLETALKEGLQRTGLAEIVDSRAAVAQTGDALPGDVATAAGASALAGRVGAGLLVTGRYLAVGDSLQLEASLLDLSASSEPARIPASRIPRGTAPQHLEPIVQRTMGALAVALDPRWGVRFVPGLQAPSFDSYREYRTGVSHFDRREYSEAGEYFARAYAMEPQFYLYAVRQAYALNNAGDCAGVDSIAAWLGPRRSEISEYEGHYLDRVIAWCRGDYEAALRSAKAMARVAPRSPYAKYLAARSAIFVNRPREAVEALRGNLLWVMEEQSVDAFYADLSRALHLLGDAEEEWTVTAEWIANPRTTRPYQALGYRLRTAAAAGALDSVAPVVTRLSTTRGPAGRILSELADAAEELRWHGHADAAADLAREALQRATPDANPLTTLQLLFVLDRTDDARRLADSLVASDSSVVNRRGWVGVLAAHAGDTALAASTDRWLARYDDPYTRRGALLWRARIHAQLGDAPQALRLVREAYTAGISFISSFHADPFLEPLLGNPEFEEFLRPKG